MHKLVFGGVETWIYFKNYDDCRSEGISANVRTLIARSTHLHIKRQLCSILLPRDKKVDKRDWLLRHGQSILPIELYMNLTFPEYQNRILKARVFSSLEISSSRFQTWIYPHLNEQIKGTFLIQNYKFFHHQ